MTKGKKIALIVVSAIVCAIIISIVTLAIVQSTFYSPALNNVKSLNIYVDGTPISIGECVNKEYFNLPEESKSRQYFDGVMEANKTSSNESVLTCMFSGAYGFEHKYVMLDTELSTVKEKGYVVEYKFMETQTLVIDDEECKDTKGNTIQYDSMFIQVNDTKDLTETFAYLYNNKDTKSKVRVNFLARQTELYNFISEITAE